MKHSLEYILWLDPHSQDEWAHADDQDCNPVKCETIGILVKETETTLTLSHTRQLEFDTYCCTIHIPKICIVQRLKLKAVVE